LAGIRSKCHLTAAVVAVGARERLIYPEADDGRNISNCREDALPSQEVIVVSSTPMRAAPCSWKRPRSRRRLRMVAFEVCHKCAVRFGPICAKVLRFNTRSKRFRAGLVMSKLLIRNGETKN
jgi:hypothetical protein